MSSSDKEFNPDSCGEQELSNQYSIQRDRSSSRQKTEGQKVRDVQKPTAKRGKPKDQKSVKLEPTKEWMSNKQCQQLVIILTLLGRNIVEHKAGRIGGSRQQNSNQFNANNQDKPKKKNSTVNLQFVMQIARFIGIDEKNNHNTCVFFFESNPRAPTYIGDCQYRFIEKKVNYSEFGLNDKQQKILDKVKEMLTLQTLRQIMNYIKMDKEGADIDNYIQDNVSRGLKLADVVVQATFTQYLVDGVKNNTRPINDSDFQDEKIKDLYVAFIQDVANLQLIKENIMKIIQAINFEENQDDYKYDPYEQGNLQVGEC